MSDRYRIGVCEGSGGFFAAAVEDCESGEVFPFPTMEDAEVGVWALRAGLRCLPGINLVFTPMGEVFIT